MAPVPAVARGWVHSHTLVNMRSTEDVRRRAGSGSCNPRFTCGNAAESLQAWRAEARESKGERERRLEGEEKKEGRDGALERDRCLTGLEQVRTEEIRASSFIIRGECREEHPYWGKSRCLYLKAKNLFELLPEEKKLKFRSSVCFHPHKQSKRRKLKTEPLQVKGCILILGLFLFLIRAANYRSDSLFLGGTAVFYKL